MLKKKFAAASVAVLAAFLILPAATAANAASYVPESNVTVSAPAAAGEVAVASFAADSFDGGSSVNFSVTGPGLAVLSTFKAATATLTKTASAAGAVSVNVAIPVDAPGDYTVSAAGVLNGVAVVGTATVTAIAADGSLATGTLSETGFNAPLLVIWGAVGVIILGVAMVAVLRLQRRSAASAVAAA